ncbi:MAG: hypothetical protein K5864_06690 [Bacteroidales bacterium]|nr:hypothetical protein [Bacteroidales bacterium]
MSNIIVVPLFESNPNQWQQKSFRQCCHVLGQHPICIVTNKEVDICQYQEIASHYCISIIREDFVPSFFYGIAGYNLLMLDKDFYKRFAKYEYMLIYQLDAWVFRDELDEWCDKGYDYIGAPWIEKNDDGFLEFAGVGNGGFSLRRIQHFIEVLGHKGHVRDANQLNLEPTLKNRIYKFFYSRGYQNTVSYYKKDPTLFEDIFLSSFLSNTKLRAKMPTPEMAARFAFEKQPSYLYSITQQLPFGCHAWRKYEYELFWQDYIV